MSISITSLNVNDAVFFNMRRPINLKNMRGRKLTEVFEYPSKVLEIDMNAERVLISGMHFHDGKKWLYANMDGKVLHIRRTPMKKKPARN